MVGGMSIEESVHDLPQYFPGLDEENHKNVRVLPIVQQKVKRYSAPRLQALRLCTGRTAHRGVEV